MDLNPLLFSCPRVCSLIVSLCHDFCLSRGQKRTLWNLWLANKSFFWGSPGNVYTLLEPPLPQGKVVPTPGSRPADGANLLVFFTPAQSGQKYFSEFTGGWDSKMLGRAQKGTKYYQNMMGYAF